QHQPAQHRLFGLDRLRGDAEVLDPGVAATLEITALLEAGSSAHRYRNSPSWTVAAAPGPVSDCHRSRPGGVSVADNPVDNRWASQELRRCNDGNDDGRPGAPVASLAAAAGSGGFGLHDHLDGGLD